MAPVRVRFGWLLLVGAMVVLLPANLLAAGQATQDFDFFEKGIRPVLVDRCYKCHSSAAEKVKGGFLLDTKEGLLKGGESGKPAIVPGDAGKSLLIEAVRYRNEDLQMPPPKQGRLTDEQVACLVAWINSGAPDPRTGKPSTLNVGSRDRTDQHRTSAKDHWSFQPPRGIPPGGAANQDRGSTR